MISAIILAAGESRRMAERNKLLLPFGEKTLIEHIVDTVVRSDAGEVIVVLGHEAQRIRDVLQERDVRFVFNENYQSGMTTSIHAGVKAVSSGADGIMVCLSDLPLIQPDELNVLIRALEDRMVIKNKPIAIPVFGGQRGNPVLFSIKYKPDILNHKGLMGCKGVVKQHPEQVLEVKMQTDHVLKDIDNLDDYEKITGLSF